MRANVGLNSDGGRVTTGGDWDMGSPGVQWVEIQPPQRAGAIGRFASSPDPLRWGLGRETERKASSGSATRPRAHALRKARDAYGRKSLTKTLLFRALLLRRSIVKKKVMGPANCGENFSSSGPACELQKAWQS